MSEKPTTLLAIKPLQYQGEQLLKDQWHEFIESMRTSLLQSGFENAESTNKLLLFSFTHPFSALTAISNCLSKTKESFSATAAKGSTPINVVLHLSQKNAPVVPCQNADASLWEALDPEKFYICSKLKGSWTALMDQKKLHMPQLY